MSALANDVFAMLSRELPPSIPSGDELEALALSRDEACIPDLEQLAAGIVAWSASQSAGAEGAPESVGCWLEGHSENWALMVRVSDGLVDAGEKGQVEGVRRLLSMAPTLLKDVSLSGGMDWLPFLESVRAQLSDAARQKLQAEEIRGLVPHEHFSPSSFPSLVDRSIGFLSQHPDAASAFEEALRSGAPSNIAAATLAHVLFAAPEPTGPAVRQYFVEGFKSYLAYALPPREENSYVGYDQWSALHYAHSLDPFLRRMFVEAVASLAQDPVVDAALRDLARLALASLR